MHRSACRGGSTGRRTADAFYQQAEVRGCAAIFGGGARLPQRQRAGREAQPGLALLGLAQGRRRMPSARSRGAHGEHGSPASRPPAARRRRDSACRRGRRRGPARLERAGRARGGLRDGGPGRDGGARAGRRRARGRTAGRGLEPLRRAFRVWHAVGAPYIGARLRVLIARACRALGDQDTAALELDCARRVFERLGAAPDLAALDAPAAAAGRDTPAALAARAGGPASGRRRHDRQGDRESSCS